MPLNLKPVVDIKGIGIENNPELQKVISEMTARAEEDMKRVREERRKAEIIFRNLPYHHLMKYSVN